MITTRSLLSSAATGACAAVLTLGLAACGTDDSSSSTVRTTPAPALSEVAAPTTPHDFTREPRCFPGQACPR
jgi:hypothetical protein